MKSFFVKFKKIFVAIALVAFIIPGISSAAMLTLRPSTGTYYAGDTFSIAVIVSSPNQSINAASGILEYPTMLLDVVSVAKSNSILDQWLPPGAKGPVIDRTKGIITFEGVGTGGYKGSAGDVFTVTFKAKVAGNAKLLFTKSSILANDGLGTNVATASGTATISLLPAPATSEPVPSETIEPIIPPAVTPVVSPAPTSTPQIQTTSDLTIALLGLIGFLTLIIIILVIILMRISRKLAIIETRIEEHEHREVKKQKMVS